MILRRSVTLALLLAAASAFQSLTVHQKTRGVFGVRGDHTVVYSNVDGLNGPAESDKGGIEGATGAKNEDAKPVDKAAFSEAVAPVPPKSAPAPAPDSAARVRNEPSSLPYSALEPKPAPRGVFSLKAMIAKASPPVPVPAPAPFPSKVGPPLPEPVADAPNVDPPPPEPVIAKENPPAPVPATAKADSPATVPVSATVTPKVAPTPVIAKADPPAPVPAFVTPKADPPAPAPTPVVAKADPPAPVPVTVTPKVAPPVPEPIIVKADPPAPVPVSPKVTPPAPVPTPVVAKADPPAPAPATPKVAPPAPVPAPVIAKADPPVPAPVPDTVAPKVAPPVPAPASVTAKVDPPAPVIPKVAPPAPVPTPAVAKADLPAPVVPKVDPPPPPVPTPVIAKANPPTPVPATVPPKVALPAPLPSPVVIKENAAQNFFSKMMTKPAPKVVAPAPEPVTAKVVPKPAPVPTTPAFVTKRDRPPRESKTGGALVAVNEATVEFTAGMIGGVAGFAVAGPAGALAASTLVNYLAKRDDDISTVVQSISRTAIEIGNFLLKLESKYDLLYKTKVSLEDVLDRLKGTEGVNGEAIEKVEKVLAKTVARMAVISEEYDLWGEATGALSFVGELVEKTVNKLDSINKDYAVTDRLWGLVNDSVATAKVAVNQVAKAEEETKKDGM